ncbi:hypothetical protein CCACVL1_08368 [Corchorus capsularis]|uniref:Uncharacterized protein n=1 Tax=Corchorus capsularis TaxID=210143 RepID=A0A1R3J0W6_COCAP|nr:hypothetical protein CCACVL1_08368 [Corchorus capsularis]
MDVYTRESTAFSNPIVLSRYLNLIGILRFKLKSKIKDFQVEEPL